MDCAVRFENVHKEYPCYRQMTAGVKSFIVNLPKNIVSLRKERFSVLNGVSFEVKRGETFGIIGRNGSGKSTILSLMAGVIRQDSGRVETEGRISSLLELGAGFHPDLSGMENIILNGILMGHTREEMIQKTDEIVEFSELGDFVYQPLRTYSSGMHVRLGFSVAIHADPEILLVDEALAVGDMAFQEKCIKKMEKFRESGATIIMVSHGMATIDRLCDRAAWIEGGDLMATGKSREVVMKYIDYCERQRNIAAGALKDSRKAWEYPAGAAAYAAEGSGVVTMKEDPQMSPEPPPSWWDSQTVIRHCEAVITGNEEVTFYEFLRRHYGIGLLDKGLSVCNKLRGLEDVFRINNICWSFDVIDAGEAIVRVADGRGNFGKNCYDLFLCVDFLHRIENIDACLHSVDRLLREKGIIIAFEYIGPPNFQRSQKDTEIADTLCKAVREASPAGESPSCRPVNASGGDISQGVVSRIRHYFDVIDIRYFGSPLYDLLLNRLLEGLGFDDNTKATVIRTFLECEQVLIREKALKNNSYAMILAAKRAG